jgi:hypothetical protein
MLPAFSQPTKMARGSYKIIFTNHSAGWCRLLKRRLRRGSLCASGNMAQAFAAEQWFCCVGTF